ncbi:unnamed protein product [Cylicocyclus nassatus]|uniref:Uncharacterized protein n=1 Tax=Cylicocyclus nassatus TaxID=53992 RepID=A0AA36GTN7_CYLNA|nr:unnamed protein product [Cylicocyclus nassatus]
MILLRQVVTVFAFVACAAALECYTGESEDKEKPNNVTTACADSFCYRVYGKLSHIWEDDDQDFINMYGCDSGVCKEEGCSDVEELTLCCCNEDLCNYDIAGSERLSATFSFLSILTAKLIT